MVGTNKVDFIRNNLCVRSLMRDHHCMIFGAMNRFSYINS